MDIEEFYRQLSSVMISNIEELNKKVQGWQKYYNYQSPHRPLHRKTPYEHYSESSTLCHGLLDNQQFTIHCIYEIPTRGSCRIWENTSATQ